MQRVQPEDKNKTPVGRTKENSKTQLKVPRICRTNLRNAEPST
jgi:hypothetical protein